MKLAAAALAVLILGVGVLLFIDHREKQAANKRGHGPCGVVVVREASARLTALADRLGDAERLASHTPRTNLAAPVRDLQGIARQARAVEVPRCLEPARFYLGTQADLSTEAFLLFASSGSDEEVRGRQLTAARYQAFYEARLRAVAACAPNCSTSWDAAREADTLRSLRQRDRNAAFSP